MGSTPTLTIWFFVSPQEIKIIRETLLRFRPDKFEGRVMSRVSEAERAKVHVQEAIGVVVQTLNELMRTAK